MPNGIHRIIDHQLRRWEIEAAARREASSGPAASTVRIHPCVTVARQIGAGGGAVAGGIAKALGRSVFDREILETIAGEGHIRARLLDLLDERDRSAAQIWVEGILRGHLADKADYLRALAHTVYSVATQGPTVFVGRGVNFLLAREGGPHLHLRIVAPLEKRVRAVAAQRGISEGDARALVEHTDADRAGFVRHHFHREIDDPQAYDLVLSTDLLSSTVLVEIALAARQDLLARAGVRIT